MRRPCRITHLAFAAAVLTAACADEAIMPPVDAPVAAAARSSDSPVIGSAHVFLMNGSAVPDDFADEVAAAGGHVLTSMDAIGVVHVAGLSDKAADAVAKGKGKVAPDLTAQWVPDLATFAAGQMPAAEAHLGAASLAPPQSAVFYNAGFQWNMEITDTDDAWAAATGDPAVRVAILDTGLDSNHQDQFNLIDYGSSWACPLYPSLTGPPAWQDDQYHGTHVGGIVTSNNFGTAGVAPNVTLVAVKVLSSTGSGSFGCVIAGIYVAADAGVDVINMSLGAFFPKNGSTASLMVALNRAVNYAHSKGVFVVAAAGNDALDLQHNGNLIQVPCETGVLSCISATGPSDLPAYYTNYGTNAINNAAPGGDFTQPDVTPPPGPAASGQVLSLCNSRSAHPVINAICPPPEGFGFHYLYLQGTSMAAPHVAGLGAFLDSQYGGALNGSQILTTIQQNADDLGKNGTDPFYGKGRINTCRTLPGCAP